MNTQLRALLGAALAVFLVHGAAAQPAPNDAVFAQGDPNAPVTLMEFASMTCPHCARFHIDNYPMLKADYIDTGRVYYVFREFPLDQLAVVASVAARCAGESRYFPMIDVLFRQQEQWVTSNDPLRSVQQIAQVAGVSAEEFQACLSDQATIDAVIESRISAEEQYPVNATPSFVLNGSLLDLANPNDWGPLAAALDAALGGASAGAVEGSADVTDSGQRNTYIAIAVVLGILAVIAFFFLRRPRASGS